MKEKGDTGGRKVGNKALDARLLPAEEPSVRSPVPVQPQPQALIPPPVRARRAPVRTADRLEAPWRRVYPQYNCHEPVREDAKAQLGFEQIPHRRYLKGQMK